MTFLQNKVPRILLIGIIFNLISLVVPEKMALEGRLTKTYPIRVPFYFFLRYENLKKKYVLKIIPKIYNTLLILKGSRSEKKSKLKRKSINALIVKWIAQQSEILDWWMPFSLIEQGPLHQTKNDKKDVIISKKIFTKELLKHQI